MFVRTALSSRKTKRSGEIASSSVRQSCRAWAIAASSCSAARSVFFFARQPQAPQRSPDRPGMNANTRLVRKLVPILRQRQMIVALDQALESRFHRIVDHRARTTAHLLGAITALLAPLLEPQVNAGTADPEALGHDARSLSLITGFKRTAAQVMGIGFGHGATPLNLPFLNPPNLHAFRFSESPKRMVYWMKTLAP
jgi:hypothetical protein